MLFCFWLGFFFPINHPHQVGEELMERRVPANGAAGGAGFLWYSQFHGWGGVQGDSSQNPALVSDSVSHTEGGRWGWCRKTQEKVVKALAGFAASSWLCVGGSSGLRGIRSCVHRSPRWPQVSEGPIDHRMLQVFLQYPLQRTPNIFLPSFFNIWAIPLPQRMMSSLQLQFLNGAILTSSVQIWRLLSGQQGQVVGSHLIP